MIGEDEWVCVECDARQIDFIPHCPACGGTVVSLHELQEADYDPLIGRKLGGRFTVVARLGAGSMGAVYRARQDGMAREVALKVLKPERAFDAGSKARFEREARATSALTSPHTVTVYDFGEDESTAQGPLLYLAMERLDGESLGSRLKHAGRVPPAQAVKLAQQALRSLAEAHDKGVVHRDLKPDNIFLHNVPTPHGMEEIVKVLDFGIAKIVQPDLKVDSLETQAGTVFGTPRYMSPEQAQSKPLDGRSDLYTIGLILFQMVTGRHCFPDEDAVVVMARHIQSLPPRPREVAPDAGISKKLEAVILRALAKDPKRRPQTALEFHEDLEAALLEKPEPVVNESAVVPTAPTSIGPVADPSMQVSAVPTYERRNGARVVAIGALFAVLLIGAVGIGVGLAQRRSGPTVVEEPHAGSAAKEATTAATTATTEPAATQTAAVEPTAAPKPTTTSVAKTKSKPTATTTKVDPPPTPTETAKVEPPPPPPTPTTTSTAKKKPGSYGKFD